jgi:hypothetical protein
MQHIEVESCARTITSAIECLRTVVPRVYGNRDYAEELWIYLRAEVVGMTLVPRQW